MDREEREIRKTLQELKEGCITYDVAITKISILYLLNSEYQSCITNFLKLLEINCLDTESESSSKKDLTIVLLESLIDRFSPV